MRPPLRRAFNLCAAASVLLFVGLCALWVRSYWQANELKHTSRRSVWVGRSDAGRLWVAWEHYPPAYPPGWRVEAGGIQTDPDGWTRELGTTPVGMWLWHYEAMSPAAGTGSSWRRLGFAGATWQAASPASQSPNRKRLVVVPDWSVALLLAVLPLLKVGSLRRRRRSDSLACPACGYDLRATPHRCPECGAEGAEGAVPKRA